MTEISHCLDSHPKNFCTIGASVFNLQAHSIQKTLSWSRKFQRHFSHFLLYPAECLTDSFMKQSFQRIISPLDKFSSHFSAGPTCLFKHSRQEQFLVQMTNQLHKEPLPWTVSAWSRLCCQKQMCLIIMKSPKLLKHFEGHILKVSGRFEKYLTEIYLYIFRIPNMTTSLTIIVDYLLTYIFSYTLHF